MKVVGGSKSRGWLKGGQLKGSSLVHIRKVLD